MIAAIGSGVPSWNCPTEVPAMAPRRNCMEPNIAAAAPARLGKGSLARANAFAATGLS